MTTGGKMAGMKRTSARIISPPKFSKPSSKKPSTRATNTSGSTPKNPAGGPTTAAPRIFRPPTMPPSAAPNKKIQNKNLICANLLDLRHLRLLPHSVPTNVSTTLSPPQNPTSHVFRSTLWITHTETCRAAQQFCAFAKTSDKFSRVLGREIIRRNRKRLPTKESGPIASRPCEATKCGHGGIGGQRPGPPQIKGPKTPRKFG